MVMSMAMSLAMVMAKVMVMMIMISEWNSPSIPQTPCKAYCMIGDITEITVSDPDNDLHVGLVTSARLYNQTPGIPQLEIPSMLENVTSDVSPCSSCLCTALHVWISAQYKWHRHRFGPPSETR